MTEHRMRRTWMVVAMVGALVSWASTARADPFPEWGATGNMTVARAQPFATALPSGDVLVFSANTNLSPPAAAASSELFHASSGAFTPSGQMIPQNGPYGAATVLPTGRVLVAGGVDGIHPTANAQVWDPSSGQWSAIAPMTTARSFPLAVTLADGRALFIGGESGPVRTTEVYDPVSGGWLPRAGFTAGTLGTATRLGDGRVLVTGRDASNNAVSKLYDPAANAWVDTAPPIDASGDGHGLGKVAARLPDGTVFVGARGPECTTSGCLPATPNQLYMPASNSWKALNSKDGFLAIAPLKDGRLLLSGPGCRLFDSGTRAFAQAAASPMCDGTSAFAPLPDGRVLAAGGPNSAQALRYAITYRRLVRLGPNLLGYWRLGEASGPTAADDLGAQPGTYSGGVTFGQPGAILGSSDTAAGFDGSTARVNLPSLGSRTAFSIEGWSRLAPEAANNAGGNNALYARAGSVRLLVRPSSVFADVSAGAAVASIGVPTPSNIGVYVHWVLARNGNALHLYRNGSLIGTNNNVPAGATPLSGSLGGVGGASPGSSWGYFLNGRIDDVAIYATHLANMTISQHYEQGSTGPAS